MAGVKASYYLNWPFSRSYSPEAQSRASFRLAQGIAIVASWNETLPLHPVWAASVNCEDWSENDSGHPKDEDKQIVVDVGDDNGGYFSYRNFLKSTPTFF